MSKHLIGTRSWLFNFLNSISFNIGVFKINWKLSELPKLGLQPNEVCMVGDSFPKDVEGATNLSIDAYWVNHDNKEIPKKLNQAYPINSFKELISKL